MSLAPLQRFAGHPPSPSQIPATGDAGPCPLTSGALRRSIRMTLESLRALSLGLSIAPLETVELPLRENTTLVEGIAPEKPQYP